MELSNNDLNIALIIMGAFISSNHGMHYAGPYLYAGLNHVCNYTLVLDDNAQSRLSLFFRC